MGQGPQGGKCRVEGRDRSFQEREGRMGGGKGMGKGAPSMMMSERSCAWTRDGDRFILI